MLANYHEFKAFLNNLTTKPTLLVHACCGPCSTHTIKVLYPFFKITLFFDNSNIDTEEEFEKRYKELFKFSLDFPEINIIKGPYRPQDYYQRVKGLEALGEFSERCNKCMELRMENSAKYAKENGFAFFTTTLSISPYKNSSQINKIGYSLADKYQINYLFSDFKKENGYQDSILMSREYKMYRQHYCGCIFSHQEWEIKRNENDD